MPRHRDGAGRYADGSIEERFIPEPNSGCWLWTGATRSNGYGYIRQYVAHVRTSDVQAHRFMYERHVGPIPKGLSLDHLCRVLQCVNPSHLEPVSHRVNVLRGIGPTARNAQKTYCPQGHPFQLTGQQTRRWCPECFSARRAAWRAALRARGERVV